MQRDNTIVWIYLTALGIILSLSSALGNSNLDNLSKIAMGIASLPHFILLLINLMGLLMGKPSCPCQTDITLSLPLARILKPLYWSNGLLGFIFVSWALVCIYMHPWSSSEMTLWLGICWVSIIFNGFFFLGCLCCMPCRIVRTIILQRHFPSISESYVFPHPLNPHHQHHPNQNQNHQNG